MTRQPGFQPSVQRRTDSVAAVLQRKCACGNKATGLSEECDECQREKAVGLQAKLVVGAVDDPFEQEADRAAKHVLDMKMPTARGLRTAPVPVIHRRATPVGGGAGSAPASVDATLRSAGEPLAPGIRAFFEPRFGHDLGRVRIHRDPPAAASARDVAAHAYTVGHHVVFASGQYAPHHASGRALLAHELAHVIQQRATVQRSAVSPDAETRSTPVDEDERDEAMMPPAPRSDDTDEHEAGGFSGVLQRQAAPFDEAIPGAPDLPSGGWPEKDEAAAIRAQAAAERECVEATPPDPAECEPARALTWADFARRAPARHRFDALTHSSLRPRAINTALLRCMPGSAAAVGAPSRGIQAFFNPARSWVKPAFGAEAGNMARNGCAGRVRSCERHFDRLARRGQTGTYSLSSAASTTCPASISARGDEATTRDECATVVGADCTDRNVAESARLLEHEQGHFDLTCAMAAKANAMLTASPNFDALLRAARTTLARQQRLYDNETNHGCNAADQARWEADIAAGLPAVTITVTAPRRRGRGRARRGRRR